MATLFKQITICGVGLIGGSLALTVREKRLAQKIVGLGRTEANLELALKRGMLDAATREPMEAARGADLVVLAVPLMAMPSMVSAMLPGLPAGAVVTDVGSVKGWVVREIEPLLKPGMSLVAAHPVAGTENTGAGAAERDLFARRRVIVTPSATSTPDALAKVEKLWQATGATVERMTPEVHDEILGRVSHLPQIVASALAAALEGERVAGRLAVEFGAGGLGDTTRVAASSADMWCDICLTNREPILSALKLFGATFAEFCRLVDVGDAKGLTELFERGRAMRKRLG
jgi:prephenate dehydrogenase